MTAAPKPITEHDAFRIEDRAPIGTRYTDGSGKYPVTLVAYDVDPYARAALPLFISDDELAKEPSTHWYDRAVDGSISLEEISDLVGTGDPALHPSQPDPEQGALARAALVNRTEPTFLDTTVFSRVRLYGDLDTDEEVEAFISYAKAELELRKSQWTLEKASRERSQRMARIADLKGSQQATAQTLGVNQSTVSRALRERPERP
ncbi:hypothetical protein ACKI10_17205 [Streptomyces galilaeus]|uniref:Helix-turn-helix domain-containing protein n=1 Tax=Streptomyces galilaeus TaxID=33899 RepID=A0ABW9IMQ9_STRGJ